MGGISSAVLFDGIYGLGFSARAISQEVSTWTEAFRLLEEIEQLAKRLDALGSKERAEAAALLKEYAGGEMSLEEVHYRLLDEGLIPMPARCTMRQKPPVTPEAEEAVKALIRERIPGR